MNNIKIRKAILEDADSFVKIKNHLPMNLSEEKSSKGGFLLGTTVEEYKFYIETSLVLVVEDDNKVIGFGIILLDHIIRESSLWKKREEVTWFIDFKRYENIELSYFEQLAFLPGYKYWPTRLAYQILKESFDNGAKALITTTVKKPVKNMAALPLIKIAHGVLAGNINETHPSVGEINSDIYIIDSENFYKYVPIHPLFKLLFEK